MPDGSIRVSTKLDTKETKVDLGKLEKECEKVAAKIEDVGKTAKAVFTGMSKGQLNSAFKTANKELDKTLNQIDAIEGKIGEIQAETDKMLPKAATDEQTAYLLEMEERETGPLIEQRDKLIAKAEEYKQQMAAITAEINAQTTAEEAQAALKTGAKDAVADAEWLGKIKTEQEYNALLEQTKAKMAVIEQEAAKIAQLTGVPVNQLLQQNTQYQDLARRLSLLVNNQAKFKGKVSDTAGAFQKLESRAQKTGKAITTAFNKGINRLSRMALGILGVRSAFMVLRRAASAYMEDNEQLTNQINALWNVLGQAIGPVIEKLVNWLTIAISYVNAFVKALFGVDLVAKANAKALNKQAAATNKAVKASRQLAGFDEMNKLSDTSTDAGDAGGASTGQFQTVPINQKLLDDFISKLNIILPIVGGIAAGLAAWKILSTFGAPLSVCAAAFLTIAGTITAITAFIAMMDGIEWGELAIFIAGVAAAAVGLGLAFGAVAAGITVVVGALALVIAGFKDWLENGKSLQALAAITIGIIAIGLSIAATPAIIIAAIAAVLIAIIMYWEEVKAVLGIAWAWVEKNILAPLAEFFSPLIEAAKAAWTWLDEELFKPIKDAITEIYNRAKEKYTEIKDGVIKAGTAIWEKLVEISDKIKEIFKALWWAFLEYIWNPIAEKLTKFYNEKIQPILDKVKEAFKSVWGWFKEHIIDPIAEKLIWLKDKAISIFKTVGIAVVDFISGLFKGIINGVLSTIERNINNFIRLLNAAIGLINKIPGVSITKVTELSIPRLAKGGIVNNPGRGVPVIAGEAGAEAVLPLENNTGWMDILAEKINGGASRIVIPIYLNGRKIAEEVIDLTKQRNFATNGAF